MPKGKDNTLHVPAILSIGKYFKIHTLSEDRDKLKAKCLLCEKDTLISGSLRVSTNFRTHLRRKHPKALEEYEKLKTYSKVSGTRINFNLISSDLSNCFTGGQDTTTKDEPEEESNNEIFLDEISSHIDDDMDEDSISFTESVDPKQPKLLLDATPFVEFAGPTIGLNKNFKVKSKFNRKTPKYFVPGETEETKWLSTKQLERMALIEHINFSRIQREYYAEKLKIMRNK